MVDYDRAKPPGIEGGGEERHDNEVAKVGDVYILNSLVGHDDPLSLKLLGRDKQLKTSDPY